MHFYSRFECGNLLKAIKIPVKPELSFSGMVMVQDDPVMHEYDLYMQADTSTDYSTHWFYFKVSAPKLPRGAKIRLNIRNFMRARTLFQEGMLPRIRYEERSGGI